MKGGYIPRLYGRAKGKPLKPRQAKALADLLPALSLPDLEGPIDPAALFPGRRDCWLEIGFGAGEHLAWQAARHPDIGMIGAEAYLNGVAKLLAKIEAEGLSNIRIHHGDGRPLIEALADRSLGRIFALYPDPWPKARHAKRRLIAPWFFAEAARLLKSGGELRIASDVPDHLCWILMHAQKAPDFEWTAERACDWRVRPADWPATRYEEKALAAGRVPTFLTFRRR